MDKKALHDLVSLYGSELSVWPGRIRAECENDPRVMERIQALLVEEKQFEQLLLSRDFEEHSNALQQRIIESSLYINTGKNKISWTAIVNKTVLSIIFKPAFSMLATLVVGLVLGYSVPLSQEEINDIGVDDYSEFLYAKEELL